MTATERITMFVIYLGVCISAGSLTGLIEDHPLPWIFFSLWMAIALARQK